METWELVLGGAMLAIALAAILAPLFWEDTYWGLKPRPWLTKRRRKK